MTQSCQACEMTPATVIEPCDDEEHSFLACSSCYERLQARALRPIEWYNLAKRHGTWQYLLHDDFYDEDGNAEQPEIDVPVSGSGDSAPKLSKVRSDTEQLLDFTITQWFIREELSQAWNRLPKELILKSLINRFERNTNIGIRAITLEIAAIALKDIGATFVRNAWLTYPTGTEFWSLAQSSASCLPKEEGFSRVKKALADLQPKERMACMGALSYFQSAETLAWIEENISDPHTEAWGRLAANSEFDWTRATQWLQSGRPLSLVSIDALCTIAMPNTALSKSLKPTLLRPPTTNDFIKYLTDYAKKDSAHRVTQRIEVLIQMASSLTQI